MNEVFQPKAAALTRAVFRTSRLAEFTSAKELVNQTGHAVSDWPLVILKELVDNALDACEESGAAPVIQINVADDGITVEDHGPGIAVETVVGMLDFGYRISSREAYSSPTRGAQGNALKTILAMPFALHGERGETLIESRGVLHRITFTIDPIHREPRIEHQQGTCGVKIGTKFTVIWPNSASLTLDQAKDRFLQVAHAYGWLNPHATIFARWTRENSLPRAHVMIEAAVPAWLKWRPSDPTSPHWYDPDRLARLIAAHVAHAENQAITCKTVREFVSEFRGLSATAKAKTICDMLDASRMSLAEFFGAGNSAHVQALLAAMKAGSRPVKPKDLGLIGKECLLSRAIEIDVAPESFEYGWSEVEHDGSPYLIEVAFGYRPEVDGGRILITGINWSPAIGSNPFRVLRFGESLDTVLANQYCDEAEPVAIFVHLAGPRIDYVDRGKSSVTLPRNVGCAIADLIEKVTKKWAKQRKAEDRRADAQDRREEVLIKQNRPMSVKDPAYSVMERAYLEASAGGTLPANPRQIYYKARPLVMALTGKQSLDSQYFCQTLLINYIEENDVAWDIVWDDRGHFREPHTGRVIGLGTLAVRQYLRATSPPSLIEAGFARASIKTHGPLWRFGACLFLEKEGFQPVLEAAGLAERFDIAVMSSKGMSVTAARILADHLAKYGIPLLTLHDFDVSGFSIGSTVGTDSRRYQFANSIKLVNLGLRLEDVETLGLEFEPVHVDTKTIDKLSDRLQRSGAASEEIEVLTSGRRCELNAMASDQFVRFVERKLAEHGVKKVVPGPNCLGNTYRLFARGERVRRVVEECLAAQDDEEIAAPVNLEDRVRRYLEENPVATWDEAVRQVFQDDEENTR